MSEDWIKLKTTIDVYNIYNAKLRPNTGKGWKFAQWKFTGKHPKCYNNTVLTWIFCCSTHCHRYAPLAHMHILVSGTKAAIYLRIRSRACRVQLFGMNLVLMCNCICYRYSTSLYKSSWWETSTKFWKPVYDRVCSVWTVRNKRNCWNCGCWNTKYGQSLILGARYIG